VTTQELLEGTEEMQQPSELKSEPKEVTEEAKQLRLVEKMNLKYLRPSKDSSNS